MARHRKKGDLPQKVCATCGRPFAWRKAWADVWDEVRYCSERCRRSRAKRSGGSRSQSAGDRDVPPRPVRDGPA